MELDDVEEMSGVVGTGAVWGCEGVRDYKHKQLEDNAIMVNKPQTCSKQRVDSELTENK